MTQSNTGLEFGKIGVDKGILTVLNNNRFNTPTPIQGQCVPEALNGKDIVGIAQTGTGKTLAFILPIVQNIVKGKDQALVVTPTRELAIQVNEMFEKIGKPLGLKGVVLIGGDPMHRQIREVKRNPDVIIATPGRLLDHLKKKIFNFNKIKIVVLDEADHMFDIGFLPDVQKILSLTPPKRQTLLFSATMPPAIVQVISKYMSLPVRVEVAPSGTAAAGITQELFMVNRHSKILLLQKILNENSGKILIFLRTKNSVKKITQAINNMNHSAVEIHSDRSLYQRRKAMNGFKDGKYRVLVATDIAARGINVSDISLVINYDLPQSSGDYVHRIGRTARAGSTGKAISFVNPDQKRNIKQIESLMKKTINVKELPTLKGSTHNIMPSSDFKKEESKKRDNRRGPKNSRRPFKGKIKNNRQKNNFYRKKRST